MTITKEDAQMLAALAVRCRPTGARQWKPDDVMAEIHKIAGQSLPAVICAVTRAAMDRGANRPSVISSPGSHWGDTMLTSDWVPNTIDRAERCSVCSKSEKNCRTTKGVDMRHGIDPHEFRSAAMAAKDAEAADPAALTTAMNAIRASIEPTQETPVKTLDDIKADRPEFAARLAAIEARHPRPALQETESSCPEVPTTEGGTA